MESKQVVALLTALAQETRLAIFRLLIESGPTGLSVGEIGAEVGVAPATLSFHLKELNHAGLIVARQQGRYIYYAANFPQMNNLLGFLTENCCARDGMSCDAKSQPRCNTAKCAPAAKPASGARRKRSTKGV
jgi:DNA-binding transcriptional ArsR family regulator